jgi:dTDP-4-dehydrorhamnose reductase
MNKSSPIKQKLKVLILGAGGMLGNTILRDFSDAGEFEVFATARKRMPLNSFPCNIEEKIIYGIDAGDLDALIGVFGSIRPDIVINCIGVVKQLEQSSDPIHTLPINSILPHRLARICQLNQSRLIQISTDCVFSGSRGMYTEESIADADDLYGRSKLIGEVYYPNSITIRTSIIGHEVSGNRSLINWFLSQNGPVNGYTQAIFSGLPTVVLARIIRNFVIPNRELTGLFHVSSDPISKYELLRLVAKQYAKKIDIIPDDSLVIDRSLDSSKFRSATGFIPMSWPELIKDMYDFL